MKYAHPIQFDGLLACLGMLVVLGLTACGGSDEPDPCADVECEVGVCDASSGECVNPEQCGGDDECLAGTFCEDGACESADAICEDIECARGVCSAQERGCVNADSCDGDDSRCVDEFFCDDSDECQPDPCVDVECPDGVCDPTTGACTSDDTCQQSADCPPNHLCVEDTCRYSASACGDADGDGGCPGNQLCVYDADQLSAECHEPTDCETSLDCTEDRQCAGRHCMAPQACDADIFEPNDTRDEATLLTEVSTNRSLSASLCAGDVDVYRFDTNDLSDRDRRATLIVDVDIARRDIGLGEVEARLIGPDGTQIDGGSTGAHGSDPGVHLSAEVGLLDDGDYVVEVGSGPDMSDAGVHYDLAVDLVPNETAEACDSATPVPIQVNQRLSGSTDDSSSLSLGSSCTDEANSAAEVVYAIELDGPKEVRFHLSPSSADSDLSMSIRRRCIHRASEEACADDAGAGEPETMTALLGPGIHYVVVQAATPGRGGAFQLVLETINTLCSGADDYCADADTAQLCAADGGRFITRGCDAGCEPTTGRCEPPDGNLCVSAPTLDADTSIDIDLLQVTDDYRLDRGECVDDADRTHGPDQTYRVDLPAQTAVTARVMFQNDVAGSVYIAENCPSIAGSCLAGATGSTQHFDEETLTYANTTDQDETVYLVVDTAADQTLSDAQLEVSFDEVICTPGAGRCSPDDDQVAQQCNEYGTGYVESAQCDGWGCSADACLKPDTCASALDATGAAQQSGGVVYDLEWDAFTDEVDQETCGLTTTEIVGPDAIFAVDLSAGEVLHASLDAGGGEADPGLIITGDCAAPDNACYVSDRVGTGSAQASYRATSAERVHIIANSNNQGTRADSQLHLDIADSQCDPSLDAPRCATTTELEYCDHIGAWQTYTCSGGCQNDACVDRTAEVCQDAPDVTTQASQAGGYTVTGNWDDFANDYEHYPSCAISPKRSVGEDAVYAVTLTAGETLQATLDIPSTPWATLSIVTNCPDVTNSCVASDTPTGSTATTSYTATTAETVYVVADHDWPSAGGFNFTLDISIN